MTEQLNHFMAEANEFISGLKSETDRGAALVGIAFLEDLFERLVQAHTINDACAQRLLERQLYSFSAKYSVAYALGWIGPQIKDDIHDLCEIRNKFAHSHERLSFDNTEVSKLCAGLRALKFTNARVVRPKDQFFLVVLFITMQLWELCRSASRPSAGADPPVHPITLPKNGA
jgi:hypothetical protein